MSQYPNPPFNSGYGVPDYYSGPRINPRPGAVTGVAITGIILGILGLLCAGPGIFLTSTR
jgi:hypothetical protein